jgi:S1-C subfamily serine protease/regulation of enolase protein 1 (concanavalin A-like superfamily)
MQGRTIACPGCRHQFRAGQAQARSAKGLPSILDEDEDDAAAEPAALSQGARSRGPYAAETPSAGGGTSPLVLAAIGIGGVCAVLLLVVVVLLVSNRGGSGERPADGAGPGVAFRTVSPNEGQPVPVSAPTPQPTSSSSAPTAVDDEAALVNRLKDATILIKLQVKGKTLGSGTGFVIRTAGDAALIATNRHVIAPDVDDPKALQIVAVFRSGEPGEQELPAQVVAADFSGELSYDLALVQVKGVTRPVVPIDPAQPAAPRVTMKYSAYGFPLSMYTNTTRGNPTITVTSGSVAALRNDDAGQLSQIQLDGSVQPGNSGGPILDAKGKLIGVAVAKVAVVDTIGIAIPADHLREFLAGRIGAIDFVLKGSQSAQPDLEVKAQVIDPEQHIKGVKILVAPAEGLAPIARQPDGSWPPLPGAEAADLAIYRSQARGRVKVALRQTTGPGDRKIVFQTAFVDASGKTVYSTPKEMTLPSQDGRLVAEGKFEALKRRLARKSLTRLGKLVEDDDAKTPDECKLDMNKEAHKVAIELPGGKPFTLAPTITSKEKRSKPLHNAPRMLADVEGDFVAVVQVGGNINPGIDPISDPRGKRLPFCFQGAGLIVYQDNKNFLRLERACRTEGTATLQRELLVEAVHSGRVVDHYYINLPGDANAPMDLIMIRKDDRMKLMFSFDQKTLLGFRDLTLDFPSKVQVGLTATNLSKKPFTARFEDFLLLNNKEELEEEFGE